MTQPQKRRDHQAKHRPTKSKERGVWVTGRGGIQRGTNNYIKITDIVRNFFKWGKKLIGFLEFESHSKNTDTFSESSKENEASICYQVPHQTEGLIIWLNLGNLHHTWGSPPTTVLFSGGARRAEWLITGPFQQLLSEALCVKGQRKCLAELSFK